MTETANDLFSLPLRVYIEDTDAGGIVYHAKYLHFMERARTEWVRSYGVGLRDGLSDNISYVVQKLSIHYGVPAKLDDQLLVTTEPMGFGRVWINFRQRVLKASDNKSDYIELASADVRVACIALDSGRPRRLPPAMADLLAQSQKPV